MNRIIRKRLLALFSAVGLAGSVTNVAAQAAKGSEPTTDQKAEAKIKNDKNKQENSASQGGMIVKADKAKASASEDNAIFMKVTSANAENTAAKDAGTQKTDKATAENNATASRCCIKLSKAASGASATQKEADQKTGKTTPK